MKKNNDGFTVKELAMVLVVIAILCIAAIPPFFALQKARNEAEENRQSQEITKPADSPK